MAEPIFVRGVSPFYGWRTLRPLHPKSLRQIGEAGVFRNELRKRVRTSHVGGSFFVGNGEGIEALAKPIFVRGVSPFNGSGTAVLATHPKSLRQIGEAGFWGKRTPEACTNPSCGRFVFCWERGGYRSIGGANLRKGHSPFNGRRTLRPNPSCGRFVLCWERSGDRSIGKANLRKGLAPSMEAAPPSPVPFRVAFGGEIFLNIGEFYFTAKYGRQYLQFYHRFVL